MNSKEFMEMLARANNTNRRRPRHNESHLQQACKKWFDLQYPKWAKLLFAVPNGGYRDGHEARIMKAEGVVAGVADMILLMPRQGFGSLCIEFKTNVGRQSQKQREWQAVAEMWGNKYVVIRTFDGFQRVVTDYLSR